MHFARQWLSQAHALRLVLQGGWSTFNTAAHVVAAVSSHGSRLEWRCTFKTGTNLSIAGSCNLLKFAAIPTVSAVKY